MMIVGLTAMPAYPERVEYKHLDQSVTIRLFGDESVKWAETEDQYTLLHDPSGYLVYAIPEEGGIKASNIRVSEPGKRTAEEKILINTLAKNLRFSKSQIYQMKQIRSIMEREATKSFPVTGNRKLVMLLTGFSDKPFSKSKTDFINLMNQVGYSVNNASGSVKDWFLSNSFNQLNLTTDVYGPYQVSQTRAYYGANDSYGDDIRPRELVSETINLADNDVDFSIYDNDQNGTADGIYLIYSGYGEEAGTSANAIWAHAWSIPPVKKDQVWISSYSCSPELSGNTGTNISNIGVICHEFSHVCGLPDFYDTDYAGSDGQSFHLMTWDPMASGSWNNEGKTPPHHNCYSKSYLGWQTTTLLESGISLIIPSATSQNVSYRFNTNKNNEFFMFENRQKAGWDQYLPSHGLLIYHIDKNWAGWSNNKINATPYHQGMDLEEADNIQTSNSYSGDPFPGSSGRTDFSDSGSPSALTWSGEATLKPITNISEQNGQISLDFMGGTNPTLPVTFSSFTAITNTNNSITLNWETQTESNLLGYNVYRSTSSLQSDGIKINPVNIPAQNQSVGNCYQFTDEQTGIDQIWHYWIQTVELNGEIDWHGPVTGRTAGEEVIPAQVCNNGLGTIYPNPFNPITNIDFMLEKDSKCAIKIYNIKGKLVKQLVNNVYKAGKHNVVWDGGDIDEKPCGTGVYFIIMKTGDYQSIKKVMILK